MPGRGRYSRRCRRRRRTIAHASPRPSPRLRRRCFALEPSSGDAHAKGAMPPELDIGKTRQDVDGGMSDDQGPGPAPPEEDRPEGQAKQEVPRETTPSLVQVIGA